MRAFRLMRPEYAPGLDGLGALKAGGRWNSPGRAAVYTAQSLSLATLEVFVHLPPSMRTPEKLPRLVCVELEIPDGTPPVSVEFSDLPETATIFDTRAAGDAWIEARTSLVLSVPSLVIPLERNFVLNPDHPGMRDVRVLSTAEFIFDPRMAQP